MKKLLPVITVSLLAAVPASAGAAQMGGGAFVGAPSDLNRGVFEQIWFKTPRSLPGKMVVSMEVDNLRCEDAAFGVGANEPITTGVNRFEDVKVARDGSFSGTFVLDQTAPTGEKSKGRSTLNGKLRGGQATGTIKAFLNVSDENGNPKTRCELKPTHWVASSARLSRDRVEKPGGRHYAGVNDTRSAAHTRLNALVNLNRARKKGAIVVGYNAPCTQEPKNPFSLVDFSPVFRVQDGEFIQTETYTLGDPSGAGFAARIRTRYTGAFVKDGVKGKLRIRATLFQDGQEIDRCDTGKKKWRAAQV